MQTMDWQNFEGKLLVIELVIRGTVFGQIMSNSDFP